jgi:hypothetical protein
MQTSQADVEKIIAGHNKRQEIRKQQIEQIKSQIEIAKVEYLRIVTEIADKRKLDPHFMAIDPEKRTLRDLRNETDKKVEQPISN